MGVLEDAIREHLDLKRQHGAEEDELRNQEAEALGPARREVDEEAAAAEETAPADAPVDPFDEPTRLTEAPPADEPEPGLPFDAAGTGDTSFQAEDEARPEPVLEDEPFVTDEPFGGELRPEELPPEELAPGDHPPPADPAAEGEDEDEDVLEETPDFLSETPEHDRLWFEQKPPRDFDFD